MSASCPKLVLLPGLHGTGELFKHFIEALPVSTSVEIVEYPPDHYLSTSDLASRLQHRIEASEPFVLVAESFSTLVAVQCASENPPNLKGLVICAGFVTSPLRGWRRAIAPKLLAAIVHLRLPKFVVRLALTGPDASASLVDEVQSAVSRVPPSVLAARLRTLVHCDLRVELGKVTAPVLYLQAAQDYLIDPSCLDEIRGIVPNLTIASVPGPHLLLQKEPMRTVDIVTNFARGLT